MGRRVASAAPLVALLVFGLAYAPIMVDNAKWLDLGIELMYVAGAATGVHILLGRTGLLSLGHYGFFIAGGYAGAIFTPYALHASWMPGVVVRNGPWFGFVAAFVVASLLGAVLALMCCHLRGFYLTVVTLAFAGLMPSLATVLRTQLGGVSGREVTAVPDTSNAFLARDSERAGVYYLGFLFLVLTLLLCRNLSRSRWGRALTAIRESELAAKSSGVETYWCKVAAFAVSAGIVGVAGWVGALRFLNVSSGETSDVIGASFRYVVIIVVGGMGTTVAGPVVGAVAITLFFGLDAVQQHLRNYQALAFGVIGLVTVAGAPDGLVGRAQRAAAALARRMGGATAAVPDVVRHASTSSTSAAAGKVRRPEARRDTTHVPVLLEVDELAKRFGGINALSGIDLAVRRGSVHALIGPNGSGKSTLVNIVSGLYQPTSGVVRFEGHDLGRLSAPGRSRLGVARTFQNLQVWGRMSVLDNVMVGAHGCMTTGLGASLAGFGVREERAFREAAHRLLEFVGLGGRAAHAAGTLAFADQRRLEIARALASAPDLLLLDEPATGMLPVEVAGLAELIQSVRADGVTVLLIEHDMDLVMGVSDTVSVLDYGVKIAEGDPADVRSDPRVVEAYLGVPAA